MSAAPRLYLATPPGADAEALAPLAERLLATGLVACLRLDPGPEAPEEAAIAAANRLQPIAHAAEVALVIADRPGLVGPLGLDGVHLSRDSGAVAALRKRLGREAVIGVATALERHEAMSLAEAGADYVAIGPFDPGPSAQAAEALLGWWSEMIETPSVAEGAVTLETAERLARVSDFVVPEPGIWTAEDPVAVLRAYAAALGD